MTLETSKCSDFFALTFTTKCISKGWDVVKHWFLFLRVETHRVNKILKKLLEAMLCLFSQRLMMEIMPDENLYYIQQGAHKNERNGK